MKRVRGTVAYVGMNGSPTLTSEYEVEPHEQEVIDLRDLIIGEGYARHEAAYLAYVVLIGRPADPVFTEWLSDGMFTFALGQRPGLVGTRPEYEALLDLLCRRQREQVDVPA